jgi:spermidine dehydrogenase
MPSFKSGDTPLGMNQPIHRRDFLNSTLLTSGGALLGGLTPAELLAADDWTGYGGIGDYAHSNGNTAEVMNAAHRIRDHAYDTLPADVTDTGEIYDCAVVGGGISGLAAAMFFHRGAGSGKSCIVLDNHPIFGGEAKRNEFEVDGHRLIAHQGSAFFPIPYPHSFIARFYEWIGVDWRQFQYQTWSGPSPEMPLSRTPYQMVGLEPATYGIYFGAKFGQTPGLWLIDPWGKKLEGAPISENARADLLRWRQGGEKAEVPKYAGDPISRRLDTITLEDYLMERYHIGRDTIRTFLSPIEGGGYGLGPDVLSGYCAYAPDMLHPLDISEGSGSQMFADGNAGFARHMVKTLVPDSIDGPVTLENLCHNSVNFSTFDRPTSPTRIRLGSTAVWVRHEGDPEKSEFVNVLYTQRDAQGDKVYLLRARSVVMAGGSWTTKHIVRDLPARHREAYAQFYRSPCLMANVAVRNWRFLYKLGITGCRWFEGLGNYMEVRKLPTFAASSPTVGPDSPVVLTVKILYSFPGAPIEAQGQRGRAELLGTSFREYERRLREQFTAMFARSGFDASRDIAGIILNRSGHAYVNPQPGFFFGKDGQPAPRDVLRGAPFGRIAFANTDLEGAMDHRNSILEAHRAVSQLLDQVLA